MFSAPITQYHTLSHNEEISRGWDSGSSLHVLGHSESERERERESERERERGRERERDKGRDIEKEREGHRDIQS